MKRRPTTGPVVRWTFPPEEDQEIEMARSRRATRVTRESVRGGKKAEQPPAPEPQKAAAPPPAKKAPAKKAAPPAASS